ncbi:MAG TPA: cysteine desulfurase NifS [Myxococcota bacterium]|nr:cysteine desulfurase NifS [Myxococcota bacterium]HRY95656.1 cysteine desulfurase NifS [Myxococcota bacterium]
MSPAELHYLDNNATTRVAPEVVEAMLPFHTELYGNPSSIHRFGGQVHRHLERARESVARMLGAHPSEIVFTAGGSEGDNLAIRGALEAMDGRRRHLVTSRVEHPAVQVVFQHLAKQGYRVTEIGVDRDGALDMPQLEAALTPETALVSLMWANNETGVLFPVERVAALCKAKDIVFHTDAVQAAGKLPIDLSRAPIDLLTISGHKLHAPKGVGALYVRRGTRLTPQILGGHQEQGRRAGTENSASIVGLGVACELALAHMDEENVRVRRLRDRLEAGLLASCKGALVNGKVRLPNTLNVSFEFIEGESILIMLDDLGVAASSGSACASGSLEPSHVLRAMGVPFTAAHGSVRFSLSRYNTDADVDQVLAHMPGIVERLRAISPFVEELSPACQERSYSNS